MPIYEYRCNHCGHRFERMQKMSDPDPGCCPQCAEAGEVTRLISAVGFRLKGGGWYETDFKHDKRHNVVESGGEEKQKTESGDSENGSGSSAKSGSRPDASEKKKAPSKPKSDGKAEV